MIASVATSHNWKKKKKPLSARNLHGNTSLLINPKIKNKKRNKIE
jgi:hypothetical protein